MPTTEDILWFKTEFGQQIRHGIKTTPFDLSMLTAVACQETGYIWAPLRRKGLPAQRILNLCVGDTIDNKGESGRQAFPKTRAALESAPRGREMFAIARAALVDLAAFVPGYAGPAAKPDKFCHGFGVFQYDLQFFKDEPEYFLERRYESFGPCLDRCVRELKRGLKTVGLSAATRLTPEQAAYVAIAYNTGGFKPAKGLKQGYYDKGSGKFYGELYHAFLLKCLAVPDPVSAVEAPEPVSPGVPAQSGRPYVVDTEVNTLRLRSAPHKNPRNARSNVIADLPDGQPVRVEGIPDAGGFVLVSTTLNGTGFRGWCAARYLRPVAEPEPVRIAAVPEPAAGLPEAHLKRSVGVTRRKDPAGAYGLNEPAMPQRNGADAPARRKELEAIIDYLAVDAPAHLRYQPTRTATFCNIYAHDYCGLAGAYLPRVWWTPPALVALSRGEDVAPLYGKSVDEQRANDLFRWLRDYGATFGWHRAASLTALQKGADEGGVGLIVARRREEHRSGHIVAVIPESPGHAAVRDAAGLVVAPLQSQAGSRNFRRATGTPAWWTRADLAEFAFWLHD